MKVSVCIASFNGEKYIKKQIESILLQLSTTDEIIISDDGSTDRTLEIIESFNDSRIKVFNHQSYNIGKISILKKFRKVTRNFENSLKHADGDIIFLSDQDDIWSKDKIEISLKYLLNCDLIVSDYNLIDESDIPIVGVVNKQRKKRAFFYNLLYTPYFGCGMAFTRRILNNSLPFPKNLFAHDLWIGFVAQHIGKVEFIDNKLIYHRRHGKNVSYSFERSKNSLIFKLGYRFDFLITILMKYIKLGLSIGPSEKTSSF